MSSKTRIANLQFPVRYILYGRIYHHTEKEEPKDNRIHQNSWIDKFVQLFIWWKQDLIKHINI